MITTTDIQEFMEKKASGIAHNGTRLINLVGDKAGVDPENRFAASLGFIPGAMIGNKLLSGYSAIPRIGGTIGVGALSALMAPALWSAAKSALADKKSDFGIRGGIAS